jgi:hypothetical protein
MCSSFEWVEIIWAEMFICWKFDELSRMVQNWPNFKIGPLTNGPAPSEKTNGPTSSKNNWARNANIKK